MSALQRSAEIANVSDKARRERIKRMVDYCISSIIREKTREAADSEVIFRELKAYIELVRDMTLSLS